MTLLDKLLLVLLVVMLPLGIIFSRKFMVSNPNQVKEAEVKRIEALLEGLSKDKKVETKEVETKEESGFNITLVNYASESAVLKVAGVAVDPKMFIWIGVVRDSTVDMNPLEATAEKGGLGKEVVWQTVKPRSDGSFVYEYVVSGDGIVEVRLEQNKAVETVRYNLTEKRRVF